MKTNNIKKWSIAAIIAFTATVTSCKKDLQPTGALTTANAYTNISNYLPILAKSYTAFAISGQTRPAGNPDIQGIDEGFSNYMREYYNMQELPTDEAQIVWNDGTVHNLHDMTWDYNNEFIRAMFDRIYYEIDIDNEFLRQTTDDNLAKNGITGADVTTVHQYRAEARFLRALSYWHAIDLYGDVPFVTENDAVSVFFPVQKSRVDVFAYIESELKAIDNDLGAPRFSYGHADKAAAWTLLAKLYLNAQVYTGTARYTDAITYASKVIASGAYSLEPHWKNLFLADNNNSKEIIFPIESDGLHTQGYGGMTYIIHAPVGGKMNPVDFGINGGWAGIHVTPQYVSLFSDITGSTDKRAVFFTDGQTLDIADESNFNDGYAVAKFKNVTSAGVAGSDPSGNFPDTDFPMFRLADVYLTYAEAVLRGGTGGDAGTALSYVNAIRTRAYDGSNGGNITAGQLNLQYILDERGRELLFECQRRTDLIRFGKFTDASYVWQWKGGTHTGAGVSSFRNLMPIPQTQIVNNPNLKQNPGY